MAFSEEQITQLSAPLDPSKVKERSQAGFKLSYVEGWQVIAEANRIFGHDGWSRETVMLEQTNRDLCTIESNGKSYEQWRIGYIAKVRITVGDVVRDGTGYGSGMGKPNAVGDAVEGATKEAETDATKRALMTFGWPFGLALYDKSRENVAKPEPVAKPEVANKFDAETVRIRLRAEKLRGELKSATESEVEAWTVAYGKEINGWPDAIKAFMWSNRDDRLAQLRKTA